MTSYRTLRRLCLGFLCCAFATRYLCTTAQMKFISPHPIPRKGSGSTTTTFISGPDLGARPDCWTFAEYLRAHISRKGSGSTTTKFIRTRTTNKRYLLWLGRDVLDNDIELTVAPEWADEQILESKKTGESGGLALWKQRIIWDECLKTSQICVSFLVSLINATRWSDDYKTYSFFAISSKDILVPDGK